jgi:predicted neuraminidase
VLPSAGQRSVHVGSICELADGRLAAAWYGGSQEGAVDVAVYFATKDPITGWSTPRALVTRQSASRELGRFVRKVGNSVVFTGPDGRLWLLYVSVTVGGWSGSSLNAKVSPDGGATWSDSERLTLSPLANVSNLVKNKPVRLVGGGFVVPISHENIGKFAELLWLDGVPGADLRYRKTRLTHGHSYFQPTLAAQDEHDAVALLRAVDKPGLIGWVETSDAGAHWSAPRQTGLPNPGAGLDALGLSDGRILIAFNDDPLLRSNLSLAVSRDRGLSWTRVAALENEPGSEFSYPALLRAHDGSIHLVYTWKRRHIQHVAFNEAWVDAQLSRTPR